MTRFSFTAGTLTSVGHIAAVFALSFASHFASEHGWFGETVIEWICAPGLFVAWLSERCFAVRLSGALYVLAIFTSSLLWGAFFGFLWPFIRVRITRASVAHPAVHPFDY